MTPRHPKQIGARLTPEEAAQLRELGGSAWVRIQINLAAFAGERAPAGRLVRLQVTQRQAEAWRALGMSKWLRQKLKEVRDART